MVDSSTVKCWMSPFVIFRGVRSVLSLLFYFRWKILLANNVDPDQMPHVASDLGLHCFFITFYRIPGLKKFTSCDPSLELPHRDGSVEGWQRMFYGNFFYYSLLSLLT